MSNLLSDTDLVEIWQTFEDPRYDRLSEFRKDKLRGHIEALTEQLRQQEARNAALDIALDVAQKPVNERMAILMEHLRHHADYGCERCEVLGGDSAA